MMLRNTSRLLISSAVLLLSATPTHLAGSEAVPRVEAGGQGTQANASVASSGRTFVLVIDTPSLLGTLLITDRGMRLVDSLIHPGDQVAIIAVGNRLRVVTDFTTTRDELRAELTRAATAALSASTDTTNADTQNLDLRGLADACAMLAQVSNRKAVVYFTGNDAFRFPARDISEIGHLAHDRFEAMSSRVGSAAPNCGTANVAIYTIHPSDF